MLMKATIFSLLISSRLTTLLCLACLLTACDHSTEVKKVSRDSSAPIPANRSIDQRVSRVQPGTPRTEVLRVAGLTEQDGAKRISYYADLCGSMEEWITSTGDQIYVQGHFFDQNGFREEPYIIGILRRAKQTRKLDEVIWSGLNLQTGVDIFAAAKAKSASPAPGGSSKTH